MEQVYIGTTNYGRHYLSAPAAASWFRMVRDGCPTEGITDALRTQTEQEVLFRKHYTTNYAASAKHDRRVWNGQIWWRKPGFPSAATPGSPQARHQWGLSLDLNGATKAWVRANGHRYGWIRDVVRGEDWHMEYQGHRDYVLVSNPGHSTGNTPAVPELPPITPLEPLEEDEEMPIIFDAGEAGSYLYPGMLGLDAATITALTNLDPTPVPRVPITKERYLEWKAAASPKGVMIVSPKGTYLVSIPGFRDAWVPDPAEVDSLKAQGIPLLVVSQPVFEGLSRPS